MRSGGGAVIAGALTSRQHEAQAARAVVEAALAASGWPWSPRLSRWVDMLILLEESER